MAITTIYLLAERVFSLIEGGNPKVASSISYNEIKLACGSVINQLLKVEHFSINEKMGEKISNGGVIATYSGGKPYSTTNGKSECLLPIKPIKLPRNMGVYSVYLDSDPENEFIPVQMGQLKLIKSQPLLNNLLGQIGYENKGIILKFNKDIPALFPNDTIGTDLVIMDISQYSDYDPLPILPEMEHQVIQEVYKLYSAQPTADKVVDATVAENKGLPLKQQQQT